MTTPRNLLPLAVALPGLRVGQLDRDRHGLTSWRPSPVWESQGQHPRLGIAFLRQPGVRSAGTGLPPWFENLLPEVGSALRQRLCAAHGVRPSDGFNLLRAIGNDLSGAVEISPLDTLLPYDAHQNPDMSPIEAELSNRLRFSLAGMQLKFSMSMVNERLVLGAVGPGGQWIVKLPGQNYLQLPEVERATMTWARNAQFDVPDHFTIGTAELVGVPSGWTVDIPNAFAVRRFELREDGSKIHQEDLCQGLELPPLHKYGDSGPRQINLDGTLRFLGDVAGEDGAREMARRIGFVIASGNDDAHLKNWGLLWGNAERPGLTPCYDLVATVSWGDKHGWSLPGGPELALGLGGERRFSRLTQEILDRHAARSGFPWAKSEILAGIERARDAWAATEEAMPGLMRTALLEHWRRVPLLRAMTSLRA